MDKDKNEIEFPELFTPELVKGWLNSQIDENKQDAVKVVSRKGSADLVVFFVTRAAAFSEMLTYIEEWEVGQAGKPSFIVPFEEINDPKDRPADAPSASVTINMK